MIKFMILFQQPTDLDTFENSYQDFLALVERMPNILRRQVVHITGSPQGTPQYYRILELYFESPETQQEALMSSIGQEAGKEIGRFPQGSVELLFADVYEEEGGSTPTSNDEAEADESSPIEESNIENDESTPITDDENTSTTEEGSDTEISDDESQ